MSNILSKSLIALAWLGGTVAASAEELRLSHQWSNNDIRHQVAQMVADEVKAANVDLTIRIFGSKSLFKPREQYRPVSRGQLDMTLIPLSYAGGQQPAYNLKLMPGLVKNHDHAARLSGSPFMKAIEAKMAEDDVIVLVHGYLAGGFAGKDTCITKPDDVKGLQMRAAGKSFEQWRLQKFIMRCKLVFLMAQIRHLHHSFPIESMNNLNVIHLQPTSHFGLCINLY